ncbi:unnamed protein product [Merluccius merluccius]
MDTFFCGVLEIGQPEEREDISRLKWRSGEGLTTDPSRVTSQSLHRTRRRTSGLVAPSPWMFSTNPAVVLNTTHGLRSRTD